MVGELPKSTEMKYSYSTPLLILSIIFSSEVLLLINADNSIFLTIKIFTGSLVTIVFPGFFIIRLIKIRTDFVRTILYSIGLSIIVSSVGVLGFVELSEVLFNYDALNPIATGSFINFLNILLLCLMHIYEKTFNIASMAQRRLRGINWQTNILLYSLLLCIMGILAPLIQNKYEIGIVSIIFICLLAFAPLIGIKKSVPPSLRSILLVACSFSILMHISLISNYITGYDINQEYFLSYFNIENGTWNANIHSNLNGMITVTLFAPIASFQTGLGLDSILKIVYPTIFSLIPLGVYCISKSIIEEKRAFLASLLFISSFVFFIEIPSIARQEIAEFLLIILIMVYLDLDVKHLQAKILIISFSFGVIISHYALSIFLIGILTSTVFVLRVLSNNKGNVSKELKRVNFEEGAPLLLVIIIFLSWSIFISDSSVFSTIARISDEVVKNIADFLNPEAVQGLNTVISATSTPDMAFLKILYIFFEGLMLIGFLTILVKRRQNDSYPIYLGLSSFMMAIMVLSLTVPFFSYQMNTTRIYHIGTLILTPLAFIGFDTILNLVEKKVRLPHRMSKDWILGLIIGVFIVANSGLPALAIGSSYTTIAIDSNKDYPVFNEQDIMGAKFSVIHNGGKIFLDANRYPVMYRVAFPSQNISTLNNNNIQGHGSFVFLTWNIYHDELLLKNRVGANIHYDSVTISSSIKNQSTIYQNNGTTISYA